MATFFSKLFRSKKNKSKLVAQGSVKTKAPLTTRIDHLDPNSPEDLNALVVAIKNVPTAADKTLILSKVTKLEHALAFTEGTSAEGLPELASKINELVFSGSNDTPSISHLSKEQRMTLVSWVKSDETVEALLSDIKDEEELYQLALKGKSSKVRQVAAERVQLESKLKDILKQAKGKDKKVYQITKDKLSQIKQTADKKRETQEKLDTLIKQIESHANTEANKLYEAKLKSLMQQWQPMLPEASQPQIENIASQFAIAKEKASIFSEMQKQAVLEQAEIEERAAEREATLQVLTSTKASLLSNNIHNPTEIPALDAVLKTQETRWLEATRNCDISKQEQKSYQQLMHELKHWHLAASKCAAVPEEIKSILDENRPENEQAKLSTKNVSTLNQFMEEISWQNDYPAPTLLADIKSLLGDHYNAKEKLSGDIKKLKADLDALIIKLDTALEEKQLKNSQKAIKEAQRILRALPAAASEKYKARIQLLSAQVDDLKDWQGFAALPKQTELCEKMESLIETNLDPQSKADKIKELQTEWKKLGGSSDQTLWQRFKQAADKAFEPCQTYFEEQRLLKEANFEKRKTICNELQEYIEKNDWLSPDWKAAERIGKTAREEWKQAFPVNFKEGKQLQATFNGLLDRLDSQLNKEREKNEALKKAIVEKANSLLDLEDLQEAINSAKNLQKEWTSIGITRYGEDRKLWKAFRAACDQIFNQRDVEKQKQVEEKNDLFSQADEICNNAESIDPSLEDAIAQIHACNKLLIELPLGSKEIAPYKSRVSACLEKATLGKQQRLAQAFKSNWRSVIDALQGEQEITHELLSSNGIDKNEIDIIMSSGQGKESPESLKEACIVLEINAGLTSPDEDQELRMQVQVNRLSAGMRNEAEEDDKSRLFSQQLATFVYLAKNNPENAKPLYERVLSSIDSHQG